MTITPLSDAVPTNPTEFATITGSKPFEARVLPWLSAAMFAIPVLFLAMAAHAETLTVKIQDVRNGSGKLTLALYGSPETFEEFSDDVASRSLEAKQGTVIVTFDNLPPGDYAIAAFHDENGNGDFDTNFLGVPEEGYGFSNDPRVFLGPPSFDEVAVEVNSTRGETEVSLVY